MNGQHDFVHPAIKFRSDNYSTLVSRYDQNKNTSCLISRQLEMISPCDTVVNNHQEAGKQSSDYPISIHPTNM